MSIFDFLGGLVKPVTDLIDSLVTTDKEKGELKTALLTLENEMKVRILEYENKLLEAQSSIIKSEATGQSSLQRNWRPITMLTFLVLVVCDSFGWLANPLAPEAWTLLQIGLGGYVVGRSLEKVAPSVVKAMKKG